MKHTILIGIVVAVGAFFLSGCGEPASTGDGAMPSGAMPDMPATATSAAGGEHTAEGTVNSLDLEAGTISISHGPVASAGWPAMTMQFQLADPDAASGVEPGQRIEFRFTTEDGGTVTAIEIAQ